MLLIGALINLLIGAVNAGSYLHDGDPLNADVAVLAFGECVAITHMVRAA